MSKTVKKNNMEMPQKPEHWGQLTIYVRKPLALILDKEKKKVTAAGGKWNPSYFINEQIVKNME